MRAKVAALLLLLAGVLATASFLHAQNGVLRVPGLDRLLGKFAVVEVGERSLDGAPALAITFSEPLDPKQSYDRYLQVMDMPLRPQDQEVRPEAEAEEEYDYESGNSDGNKQSVVSREPADLETKGGRKAKGAWVVGENPRILYFPHVRPQARYVVRVAANLPDASGKPLGEETRVSVRTAAVSPAYYFASRGMVLPAKQNGGLPVVTVNVPEVDLQVLRVKSSELPKFLDEVIQGRPRSAQERKADGEAEDEDWYYSPNRSLNGATSQWSLDRLHKMADSVYLGRFTTEKRANRRSVTYLPVEDIRELQEPGVYVAVMSQPGRFRSEYQTTYFYVSDLGLHLRLFERGADAYISSLTDGKAVANVDVSWLDAQGKVLALAKSDADGRASFAERPANARVVLARRDKQVSLIALKEPALDLSEYEITGAPSKPVRLFAYSGRDLYRPGEVFSVSVLARDADGRPVPPQPIQAILKRPDGQPQLTSSWTPDKAGNGYYQRQVELPADAPTGFWSLELRADPADKVPATVFRFGVEEFLPERMKLDLSTRNEAPSPDEALTIDVKGSYLYGAPAANNRLLGVVQFERNRNPLAARLPGFEFGDATEDTVRSRSELPETTLDEQGQAQVDVDLAPLAKRRSPFTVRTTLSLLESGGRPVVRSLERVSWPAKTLIGVRPLFVGDYARENSPVEFEVVRVDRSGKLLAGAGLPVRLFREDRHYYWRYEDQRGWHSGYTETDELVDTSATATPANGRGRLAVPVRWGRYRLEILDPESGQSLRYRFYAGWSAKADEAQGVRPDKVTLKLDKAAYKEGDTARLTILPPHAGEAIVSVEAGKTLWSKRLAVPAEGTTLDVPVAADWKRHDLYVSALVLRPGTTGDRVTPTRALGIVHLPLERGERKLAVSLDTPRKGVPGETAKVKIRVPEARGQSAQLTLSAVDVGILNITRFATPDPIRFFFGRQGYGTDLHDVYGRLIEKMAGRKGKLRFGGDNTPKPTRSLPQKVKLIDLFSGPVKLNAQGEAEIPLTLPDFNGTLRLMAVVASPDRFGSTDGEMVVAAPLVAELATPRFLSFGDSANLALDLHNLSGAQQNLKVALVGDSALKVADGERSLTLKDQQKTTLRFAVTAGSEHGLHQLTVKVNGGPLRFERQFPLMVQALTPQQQVVRRVSVEPGKSIELKDPELAGLLKGSLLAHLVVSDKPPIDVRSAIRGLLTYPYGCVEQTTSTAYPHVFVDDATAKRFGLKPFSREQRVQMLEKAMARLASMQSPQGGFNLWGGAGAYEYWLSAYVGQFLVDARAEGFEVPEKMRGKVNDFLLRGLQEGVARLPAKAPTATTVTTAAPQGYWPGRNVQDGAEFGALAYGAYVLARESKAPLSTLRQLHEVRGNAHSGLALVHLGLALRLMGDETRGNVAIGEGLRKGRPSGYWWSDYGSGLRDAALSYALLVQHKIDLPGRDNLTAVIAGEMAKHRYYSTQEQLALFLVGRHLGQADAGAWKADLVVGSSTEMVGRKGALYRELSAAEVTAGAKLTNQHSSRLYAELVLSGFPTRMPPAKNDPISLSRTLYAPDGSLLGNRPLKVGETVVVRVTVVSKEGIANGLVVDRVPAGLELENRNLVQGEQEGSATFGGIDPVKAMADPRIQHVEYRDDRFVAAARLGGQELNLIYRARVVTPGRFTTPPLYAEDMYRPEVFGLTGGGESMTVLDAPVAKGTPKGAAKP